MVVFLEAYPFVVCVLCSGVFALSMVSALILRPYKKILGNVSKIIGEACLTATWVIFLLKFVPFQSTLKKSTVLPEADVKSFLQYGTAVIIILLLFNSLYLCEFVWVQVVCRIMDFFAKKNARANAKYSSPDDITIDCKLDKTSDLDIRAVKLGKNSALKG